MIIFLHSILEKTYYNKIKDKTSKKYLRLQENENTEGEKSRADVRSVFTLHTFKLLPSTAPEKVSKHLKLEV